MKRRPSEREHSPLLSVVAGVVSAITLFVAFTLMALGFEYFWVAFVLGFGVVLPTATGVSRHVLDGNRRQESTESETREDAALARLRQRYANGELSDAEFEHRLERLLESESRSERQDAAADRPE